MSSFFPDDYIKSVYHVDFSLLKSHGYKCLLFDVDNTLVPHNAPANEKAKGFFNMLNSLGFKTYLISNNKEPRVRDFCNAVGASGYFYKAGKPSPRAYLEGAKAASCSTGECVFFGDQIFTDVWGAKNAGMRSVLVRPVKKWAEEPQIVLKRFLEAIVLAFYKIKISFFGAKNPVPISKED